MEDLDIKEALNEQLRILFDISHDKTFFSVLFNFQINLLGQLHQQIVAC